jgi:transcriptional regulator with PAS, ATPase and Fis domain
MKEDFKQIWDEYPSAVTITDDSAIIIYMNKKSISTFENEGGEKLIGQSLFDCHNPNSNLIIRQILDTGIPNTYTIEKRGAKKLIYQSPWFIEGKVAGLIELSIVLPENMPHFIRG